MAFDITYPVLIMYLGFASMIGLLGIILGLKKIDGSPFITTIAGFMIFMLLVLVENIEIGYTDERSILVSTIYIQGEEGSQFTTVHMNQTTGTQQNTLRAGLRLFAGEDTRTSSSLIGDTINSADFYFLRSGSPTGTMYCGVWDNSAIPTNANYLYLLATKDVSTIATSETKYTFTNTDNDYTITSNDAIGCFYEGGSSGNDIKMYYHNLDVFDSTNSAFTYYSVQLNPDAWADENTSDIKGAIYHTVDTQATDTQEINSHDTVGNTPIEEPFNQNDIWVFTILLAMLFMFIGVMLQFAKW